MALNQTIDLNADIGEHDGDGYAGDTALMDVVSSANIACGAHAGSGEVMRRTVVLALERGISIGAHPGYPDPSGFGRRELGLTAGEIVTSLEQQLELMADTCASEGAVLRYVKPHGALYNRLATDAELAKTVVTCVRNFDANLVVLALSGGALAAESLRQELAVAREAFIDRAYLPDGTLVPRTHAQAVIINPAIAAERALAMARRQSITALDGSALTVNAESLCVHGDSANALDIVRLARLLLEDAGFTIAPFAR